MPLIYNGQEAFNETRLEFFEKDPIEWRDHPIGDLFAALIALKTETPALWNGAAGARMVPVTNSAPEAVLSFTRKDETGGIFAMLNLSPEIQAVHFGDGPHLGSWEEVFTGERLVLDGDNTLTLPAWGYRVYRTGS